jgi:predicted GH43/DUF377 family glycosyl hydrolase
MVYRMLKSIISTSSLLMAAGVCCFAESPLDLEEFPQDFVLGTKKIEVPGYPHAFNGSIVRWKGSLLMSFRYIPCALQPFNANVGLVWLDEEFNPCTVPQIVNTQRPDVFQAASVPSRAEDARLIEVGNDLYIVYSDNQDITITRGGFRVYVGKVSFENDVFSICDIECLTSFEGQDINRREKNWTPFEYEGNLLLAYSHLPHRIFSLIGNGACETICSSLPGINWEWGELRGGTPGLNIGGQNLGFFHSSKNMETIHSGGKYIPHYFMGAYTFSLSPPFNITGISPEPIIGKQFYTGAEYERYWGSVRVVFPCGFIFDDSNIWVSYGRQDHEIWIARLDRIALLDSLKPVYTLSDSDFEIEMTQDNGASGWDNGASGWDNGASGWDDGASGWNNGASGWGDDASDQVDDTRSQDAESAVEVEEASSSVCEVGTWEQFTIWVKKVCKWILDLLD